MQPPSRRTWRATLSSSFPSRGLVAIFAFTRSAIERVTLSVAGESFASTQTQAGVERVLRVDWPNGETPPGELELSLEYRGDAPQIAMLAWLSDASDVEPVALLPDGVSIGDGLPDELDYLAERERKRRGTTARMVSNKEADVLVANVDLTPTELHALRNEAVRKECMVRRFWYELDRQTMVALGTPEWADTLSGVTYLLFGQLERRAEFGDASIGSPSTPRFGKLADVGALIPLGRLEEVSALFKTLVVTLLTLDDGSSLFEWAFVQFAAGLSETYHHDPLRQALLETHGVPNGSEFFKFGELAFACVENEVDLEFWTAHLASFVLASHLFLENTDEPPNGEGRLAGENGYGYQLGRLFPLGRREELIKEYATLLAGKSAGDRETILRDRFSSIVAQAFPDTVHANNNVQSDPLLHPALIVRQAPAPPPAS